MFLAKQELLLLNYLRIALEGRKVLCEQDKNIMRECGAISVMKLLLVKY
jgi:hypothetical protein